MAAKSTPARAAAKRTPAKASPDTAAPAAPVQPKATPVQPKAVSAQPKAAKEQPKAAKDKPAKSVPAAKATSPRQDPAETVSDEVTEPTVPLNRAERRAKGRGKAVSQLPAGRGKVNAVHGPAHTQRNWANRRSG